MKKWRPYRSRKIPACSRCRVRRAKCDIETAGKPCLLCKSSGVSCSAEIAPKVLDDKRTGMSESRRQAIQEPQSTGLHIVPPMVARDTQVLEGLLLSAHIETFATDTAKTFQQRPVYHVSIPPRRPSPTSCDCPRSLPTQLTQLVDPFFEQLLELYFKELYPCLPMLNEPELRSQLAVKSQSSQTFLVNLEAYALFYWSLLPVRKQNLQPDQDFAWQIACSAMNMDIQSGGILSIICAVLNIAGRPSKGVVHNMTNVARITALSNSIGLNHDSSEWQLSDAEKRVRWKLWWVVLIHDRWFNFAQGTPPLINAAQYDVPLPTVSLLMDETECDRRLHSTQCYLAFCKLTEVVGEILPLIYHVRSGTTAVTSTQISSSQLDLNKWLSNLPDRLRPLNSEDRPCVPGLANLHLSYLSVQMLLQRLAWHEHAKSAQVHDESMLHRCQLAAEDVVDFVASLERHELDGFWLPYNAQHFTSAVTLILRCALQTGNVATRAKCIKGARNLVRSLQDFKLTENWDMAEIALPQSERILRRIEEALPDLQRLETQKVANSTPTIMRNEMKVPSNSLEDRSDSQLFDPFSEASLEELFPGMFSTFSDYASFDQLLPQFG